MKDGAHEDSEDLEEWSEDYSGVDEHSDLASKATHSSALPARSLEVDQASLGQRLDVFLSTLYPEVSRSQIQRWIADGFVTIDARIPKAGASLRTGQVLSICPPDPEPVNSWQAEVMPLSIVYEDEDVIVLNKPSRLVVHPAAGHATGTLVNGLIAHFPAISHIARSGVVHRLDQDTTGLMVAAKSVAAQLGLVGQLQDRTVSRQYLALVWGRVARQTLSTYMGRDPRDRQRMSVLPEGKGKKAVTHVRPLGSGDLFGMPVTLLECKLETGRTHQIRVHLESIKNPIVGDRTYSRYGPHSSRLSGGSKTIESLLPGQALHAQKLSFLHPVLGETLRFNAEPPANFIELLGLAGISLPSSQ